MRRNLDKYKKYFNLDKVQGHARKFMRQMSTKGIYTLLLLFYAFQGKETPSWAKNIIIGTIGYFLSPIDAIPDLTPVIGMTDDIGVLSFGIVTIACYINDEVRAKAVEQLTKIIGPVNVEDLESIDRLL